MKIEAIDLFCGIGGLSYGLQQAGIKIKAGLDNDKGCSLIYEKNINAKFIPADVSTYNFKQLKNLYSKDCIKVLVGCAPCQPFSTANPNKNNIKDQRWNLASFFIKAVTILNPHIISMENVIGFSKTDTFEQCIKELKSLKYKLDYKLVACQDYGVPQNRKRLVLLASNLGTIDIPPKTYSYNQYKTVADVIKKMPPLEAGKTDNKDVMHTASNLSPLNIKRIKQSKPNGTWKDWDKSLLPECRKNGVGYSNVYGRMSWNNIAPTITTRFIGYSSGRFGHPDQNRTISLREGSLLQTFPKNYCFGDSITPTHIAKYIGNAVPPLLGKVIGQQIKKHTKRLGYGK